MAEAYQEQLLARLEEDRRLWRQAFEEGRRQGFAEAGSLAFIPVINLKGTREALCAAQAVIGERARGGSDCDRAPQWIKALQVLVDQIDVHRPVGTDGKHGALHTSACGCVEPTTGGSDG